MDLEDFKRYLVEARLPSTRKILTVEPYLSIEKYGRRWHVYGVCIITANFCDEIVFEAYRGKSENRITLEREEKAIVDFIHLHLDDIFAQLGIIDVEYVFKPAVEFVWVSWNPN